MGVLQVYTHTCTQHITGPKDHIGGAVHLVDFAVWGIHGACMGHRTMRHQGAACTSRLACTSFSHLLPHHLISTASRSTYRAGVLCTTCIMFSIHSDKQIYTPHHSPCTPHAPHSSQPMHTSHILSTQPMHTSHAHTHSSLSMVTIHSCRGRWSPFSLAGAQTYSDDVLQGHT